MQYKNVWTSTNYETQTKLKRTSDCVTKYTDEGLNLTKENKSEVSTILDFSRSTLISYYLKVIQILVLNS